MKSVSHFIFTAKSSNSGAFQPMARTAKLSYPTLIFGLADCAGASYGVYSYIDASDVIADPGNALEDDLTACFRTDEDRLGKIRFPEYSTDDLEIEWVTWR